MMTHAITLHTTLPPASTFAEETKDATMEKARAAKDTAAEKARATKDSVAGKTQELRVRGPSCFTQSPILPLQ